MISKLPLNLIERMCVEISSFMHSFENPVLSLNWFRIWKSFLHKSYRSHQNLQLLFVRNSNPSLTCPFFSFENSGCVQYLDRSILKTNKNRGLWSFFFKNCPCSPLGFSMFYNFVVINLFKFGL